MIINNLESNKAHGHDKDRTHMLKMCGDSSCRTFVDLICRQLLFIRCLCTGKSPLERKNPILLQRKKRVIDKQTVKNYRSVSLLPMQ